MAGINKVILVGNLGKDPEVRTIQSGAQVARFSLATSESYTNKEGQKVENTEWHNVVLWRGLATVAEKYLKKGNKVYIEGKLRNRQYEDKDGVKKYTTEIEATDMLLLDRPQTTGTSSGGNYTNTQHSYGNDSGTTANSYSTENMNEPPVNDDLPF
jgi:single-strand DNA-binding protein